MDAIVDTGPPRDKNTVVRQGDGGAVNGRNKDAITKIEGTIKGVVDDDRNGRRHDVDRLLSCRRSRSETAEEQG